MEDHPLSNRTEDNSEAKEEDKEPKDEATFQDQAQEFRDHFYSLFYTGEDQSSVVSDPPKDPPPSKLKRHERNVSFGFLPKYRSKKDGSNNKDTEPSHNRTVSHMPNDFSLLGDIPSLADTDQLITHSKPVLSHKRAVTSAHVVLPTEDFSQTNTTVPSATSPGTKHKRRTTKANFSPTDAAAPSDTSHLKIDSSPPASNLTLGSKKETIQLQERPQKNNPSPMKPPQRNNGPEPSHNRTVSRLPNDDALLGDIPFIVDTDPLIAHSPTKPPSMKPALKHKRNLTSTHVVLPTEMFSQKNSTNPTTTPRRKHKRSMTQANYLPIGLVAPSDASYHTRDPQGVASLRPPPIRTLSLRNLSSGGKKATIQLQDVIMTAPYELEAETHILKALEENNATEKASPSEPSATPNLFPHVPDRTAHDFSSTPPAQQGDQETDDVGAADEEQGFECIVDAQIQPQQTKPLLANNKKKTHRSTKSVEQTLFGLTAALSAMDNAHERDGDRKEDTKDADANANAAPLPAADKVANTAHNLATRLKKEQSIRALHVEPTIPEHRPSNGGRTNSARLGVLVGEGGGSVHGETSQSKIDIESLTSTETIEARHNNDDEDPNVPKENDTAERKSRKQRRRSKFSLASTKLKDDWEIFSEVLSPKKVSTYIRNAMLLLILPATGIATLLFYSIDNPHTGYNEGGEDGHNEESKGASISWWLIFFVRQVITLSLALATQAIVIDFLATGSWIFLRFFGPIVTLFLAQSRGWPFILVFWGLYNLALLSGSSRFANHWGYWQDWVLMFNETNPSGNVTNSEVYIQIIQIAIGLGLAVSLKRLAIGLFLGRQTFSHYGNELAAVMKQIVLVSEVAGLANEIFRSQDELHFPKSVNSRGFEWSPGDLQKLISPIHAEKEETKEAEKHRQEQEPPTFQEPGNTSGLLDLLERWEEPDRARQERQKGITISAVLQFRRALSYMQRKYPFSNAFGPCDTREECIESAQAVYNRLLLRTPGKEDLNFETITLVATSADGYVDENKVMALIKVFRPARDGKLTKLEFVKSVDNVYRSCRMLTATVANSGQIDQAFENILNVLFYIIVGCVILAFLGFDPLALFISFSGVFLAFAFVFSSASAKYFEGMIFMLVQRPYGVGDRIHVSRVDDETDPNGSSGWVVQKVTLFSTTVFWGATNECATISNAAIANSRVINAARSPHAKLQVTMKFGIDVAFDRIVIFKSAVEQYMKARPREWLQLVGFRASNVTIDRGFIEYNIIALHRESWQSIGSIQESRATLTSFCLEVAKQLDMRYMSPPLPVSLKVEDSCDPLDCCLQQGKESNRTDFRSMALSHGIKIDKHQ